jgi:hypothetical protein
VWGMFQDNVFFALDDMVLLHRLFVSFFSLLKSVHQSMIGFLGGMFKLYQLHPCGILIVMNVQLNINGNMLTMSIVTVFFFFAL